MVRRSGSIARAAKLLLAVFGLLQSCTAETIKWTENVTLPDSRVVQLQRSETYEEEDGQTIWIRESIRIPSLDRASQPFTWKTSLYEEKGSVNREIAIALYFENDRPRIVTQNNGASDAEYGCSYTNHHRLFFLSNASTWEADPHSKIHSRYVGVPNLIRGADPREVRMLLARVGQSADPIARLSNPGLVGLATINLLAEKPLCEMSPQSPKYISLEQVLTDDPGK